MYKEKRKLETMQSFKNLYKSLVSILTIFISYDLELYLLLGCLKFIIQIKICLKYED